MNKLLAVRRWAALVTALTVIVTSAATAAVAAEVDGSPPLPGADASAPTPPPQQDTATLPPAPVSGGGIVVGGLVGSAADAAIGVIVAQVTESAAAVLAAVGQAVDTSTRPQVERVWFRQVYWQMLALGGLAAVPFLLLAVITAVLARSVAQLGRAVIMVGLSAIAASAATVLVDRAVAVTDALAAWIGAGIGADLTGFTTKLGAAVTELGVDAGPAGAGLVWPALFAGAVGFGVLLAGLAVWVELLIRESAVYVCTLFLPLTFAASVWPAAAVWAKRLVQLLVAVILSKFVIVAVLAVAAHGLATSPAGGVAPLLAGATMLLLAAFAPYVLLSIIPLAEIGMATAFEGVTRRPTASVAPPRRGGMTQMTVSHLVAGRLGGAGRVPHTGGPAPTLTSGAVGKATAAGGGNAGASATTVAAAKGVAAARSAPHAAGNRAASSIAATKTAADGTSGKGSS